MYYVKQLNYIIMGATTFYNSIKKREGQTAGQAFNSIREDALYENGQGGYTGTIAEKGGISMSRKPDDIDVIDWVYELDNFDEDDRDNEHYYELKEDFDVYDDKWGDALCIETKDHYFFCGWASC